MHRPENSPDFVKKAPSGLPAPFVKTNIATALAPLGVAESGADVLVDVRGNRVRAKQVLLLFYKRPKKA